jgi:hypothetical protein
MTREDIDEKFDEALALYGESGLAKRLKAALWDATIETYLESGDITKEQKAEWRNPFRE